MQQVCHDLYLFSQSFKYFLIGYFLKLYNITYHFFLSLFLSYCIFLCHIKIFPFYRSLLYLFFCLKAIFHLLFKFLPYIHFSILLHFFVISFFYPIFILSASTRPIASTFSLYFSRQGGKFLAF